MANTRLAVRAVGRKMVVAWPAITTSLHDGHIASLIGGIELPTNRHRAAAAAAAAAAVVHLSNVVCAVCRYELTINQSRPGQPAVCTARCNDDQYSTNATHVTIASSSRARNRAVLFPADLKFF